MFIRMKVEGIVLDPTNKTPVVVLRDEKGGNTLPIWVGVFEAASIVYALEDAPPPRPITHDLAVAAIRRLGGEIVRLDVDALEEQVFRATLHLRLPHGEVALLDCRPSDGLALALRVAAPVYADENVLAQAALPPKHSTHTPEHWKAYLEGLDSSAFGKYKM